MIITYFRSSSFNQWSYCQQSYYMTYVLGLQQQSNLKADMGTVVHKTLEVLAALKKFSQDNTSAKRLTIEDDAIGEFSCLKSELLAPEVLDDTTVASINKSRTNKSIYKTPCQIDYGHIRYGVPIVEEILARSYDYYSKKYNHHAWNHLTFRDVQNWTWMALDYKDGLCDPRKRTIVEPEQRFDFIIEKPWAKYAYGDLSGHLAIKGTIDLITKVDDDVYEIIDWKGLPLETPIPTPTGWTTMGDIQVGDSLFDEDGNITKVIGKSNVKHKDCYRIHFDDGSSAESDNEHLWKLDNGEVVITTELQIGDKISLSKAIKTSEAVLPIDPYVLGVWLGDGRKRNGEITSNDPHIYQEIVRRGYTLGNNISTGNRCEQRTVYGLTTQLRRLGLLNNKHIPLIYLRASVEQRMDLLRGLMDSDGNANPIRKQAVFTSCNKRLSDDVKELLLSLGQRPNQSEVYNRQFNRDIPIYPIAFRPIGINPFSLARKADAINPEWGDGWYNRRRIERIEYIGKKYTQCIAVDSEHHTYLCTRDMIVTHNTGQRKNWATGEEKSYEKLNADPQLMLYYYAAKKLYPDKEIILTIFFIRDGGPFSVCFDEDTIGQMEALLEQRFKEIQRSRLPKLLDDKQRDFRCQKLCHFYKNKFPDTNNNMCRHIRNEILVKGIDKVTKEYKADGHSFDTYNAPGE